MVGKNVHTNFTMFTVWMDNNEFYNKYQKITVEIGNYYNGFEWGWELLFDTYIIFSWFDKIFHFYSAWNHWQINSNKKKIERERNESSKSLNKFSFYGLDISNGRWQKKSHNVLFPTFISSYKDFIAMTNWICHDKWFSD